MVRLIRVVMALAALLGGCVQGDGSGVLTGASPNAAPLRLGVLTFNIRYDNPGDKLDAWPHRRETVAAMVRDDRLDVACLQEALRRQLDDLHAACPGWGESGVGRDDGKAAGEYVAILYRTDRWRVEKSGTFWLSEHPETPGSKSWDTACTRVCTWARLAGVGERAGRNVWMFNTHLDHVSAEARRQGVKLIAERIASRGDDRPFVLAGDFNAGEDDAAVRFLTAQAGEKIEFAPEPERKQAGAGGVRAAVTAAPRETMPERPSGMPRLVDTFRVLHPKEREVGTSNNFKPDATTGKKIDYVLVPEGTRVLKSWIDRRATKEGRTASDHFAVGAIIELE